MSEALLIALISAVLGSSTIVGFILYRKALRRMKLAEASKSEAEAELAHWERYEKQLNHASASIEVLHKQIEADAQRISRLNQALDDKTDRIRHLTDTLIESEQNINTANAKIVKLTEERDRERMLKELYKSWNCHKDCADREPPNERIKGKTFKQQHKEIMENFKD